VCITDALSARGDVAAAPPTILGHAAAGIAEEVGAHVERVRAGDRVVVAGTPECGECFWCIRDQPGQCAQMLGGILPPRVVATRAGGEPVHADGGVGAFAEKMALRDYGGAHIRRDIPRFAGMLEAGLLDAAPPVSRRFALEEVNEALAAASRRELITAVIVPGSAS
jgi:S-(hydroxymethyl)glutathione dehydrogenase/alcohol dehydrogenase